MAIPTYDDIKLPLLKLLENNDILPIKELEQKLKEHFSLTPEDANKLLPNGRTRQFSNRVAWARTYLKQAGLINFPEKGLSQITKRGREVLEQKIDRITNKFLMQFPEFVSFMTRSKSEKTASLSDVSSGELSPQEDIENSFSLIHKELSSSLLEEIQKQSPSFFERLVLDLLLGMGYGGSENIQELAKVTGQSGDGGIDGIIPEDRLGLDNIYIQAKRWGNTKVTAKDIRDFIGALACQNARKGVFITTSFFTPDAKSSAEKAPQQIALIDGLKLTELMIDYNIGVSIERSYYLKRIDLDYFSEE